MIEGCKYKGLQEAVWEDNTTVLCPNFDGGYTNLYMFSLKAVQPEVSKLYRMIKKEI